MEENNLSNDSDIKKEIKDAENEAKMDAFRNSIAKNKLIKEMKGGLGELIKKDPNRLEKYKKEVKLTFLQKIKRFFSKLFKSF